MERDGSPHPVCCPGIDTESHPAVAQRLPPLVGSRALTPEPPQPPPPPPVDAFYAPPSEQEERDQLIDALLETERRRRWREQFAAQSSLVLGRGAHPPLHEQAAHSARAAGVLTPEPRESTCCSGGFHASVTAIDCLRPLHPFSPHRRGADTRVRLLQPIDPDHVRPASTSILSHSIPSTSCLTPDREGICAVGTNPRQAFSLPGFEVHEPPIPVDVAPGRQSDSGTPPVGFRFKLFPSLPGIQRTHDVAVEPGPAAAEVDDSNGHRSTRARARQYAEAQRKQRAHETAPADAVAHVARRVQHRAVGDTELDDWRPSLALHQSHGTSRAERRRQRRAGEAAGPSQHRRRGSAASTSSSELEDSSPERESRDIRQPRQERTRHARRHSTSTDTGSDGTSSGSEGSGSGDAAEREWFKLRKGGIRRIEVAGTC